MTKSILRKMNEPMAGRRKDEELVVITKTYDLILWWCNHTGRFPRNHRFVLGERIELNCRPVGPLVRVWGSCSWPDGPGYWNGWPFGPKRIENGPTGRGRNAVANAARWASPQLVLGLIPGPTLIAWPRLFEWVGRWPGVAFNSKWFTRNHSFRWRT